MATPDILRSGENINNTTRVSRISFRFFLLCIVRSDLFDKIVRIQQMFVVCTALFLTQVL